MGRNERNQTEPLPRRTASEKTAAAREHPSKALAVQATATEDQLQNEVRAARIAGLAALISAASEATTTMPNSGRFIDPDAVQQRADRVAECAGCQLNSGQHRPAMRGIERLRWRRQQAR